MRFLGKTKKIAKTTQFWSQNVQLIPIKKLNTHTLWFHPQIKELSALLRNQIAVQSRYLQWKDFQKNEPYTHRFVHVIIFLTITLRAIVKNVTLRSMAILYGNFK